MRAFLSAVLTAIVIAVAAHFVLDRFQTGSDVANTGSGTRINFATETSSTKH